MEGSRGLDNFKEEVDSGERFEFGKNWLNFLQRLNEDRIKEAEESLLFMLKLDRLDGLSFLDIGCGSGLFSLAAKRLGAARVLSFDYDPESVACTQQLKRKYFPGSETWDIYQGNALDEDFIRRLGDWDIVYSWGVLHHTGNMWAAMANACIPVKSGGKLFIAIYNDEGPFSKIWAIVKKAYNRLPRGLKFVVLVPSFLVIWFPILLKDLITGKPLRTWRSYYHKRGMSPWEDVVDWVGGYPFEVAKPEEIFRFYCERGFELIELKTTNRLGCNELVFRRTGS